MTALYDLPDEWLVCPVTKEPLRRDGALLKSARSSYRRDPQWGFWDFMPASGEALREPTWATWDTLQANSLVAYQADPSNNLGVGPRRIYVEFGAFAELAGRILDIGVGPQRLPTHAEYCLREDATFVGIDPMTGDQPRDFRFVRGLGEYLPFRDRLFDRILFVTSLDHFLDPLRPLVEARRCIGARGQICIFLGEKVPGPAAPVGPNPRWYEDLAVPPGAEDRFHFRRLSVAHFDALVEKANLKVVRRETGRIDAVRRYHFVSLGL